MCITVRGMSATSFADSEFGCGLVLAAGRFGYNLFCANTYKVHVCCCVFRDSLLINGACYKCRIESCRLLRVTHGLRKTTSTAIRGSSAAPWAEVLDYKGVILRCSTHW
eukprot:TRINITY_DN16657_c0_g1_i2.p1 TRINITY_DN16657_c0_g1~~TRINITY_DN16657_c0_g1_i2.p1  ORF type:complete len:109 (+),score=4.52 TRINITY_DN16657_c0_g1_i2:242-568(+)